MTHPEYEGLIQSADCGPDTGHYHVFVEQDSYMVPWTGGYTDSLCWTTRTKVREIADMLRDSEADRSFVVPAHSELVDAFRSVPRGRADDRYSNFLTGPRPSGPRREATASATGCKAA